jgi:hypothetical protein
MISENQICRTPTQSCRAPKQPHDVLLSALNAHPGAIGSRASVIVTFADGHEAVLDLSELAS